MSWKPIYTVKPGALTADGAHLVMNRSLAAEFVGVERIERLADGEKFGIRPHPAGVKVYRGKDGKVCFCASVAIRHFDLMNGDRLLFTGMDGEVFVFEREAR